MGERRARIRAHAAAAMAFAGVLLMSGCGTTVVPGRALPVSSPDAPIGESVQAPPGQDSAGGQSPHTHGMHAPGRADWNSAPRTVSASRVPHPYPAMIGKLFAHFSNDPHNSYDECTATAVTSRNKSTVWTSAHCINPGTAGKFAYGEFVPGFNDGGGADPEINPWDPADIRQFAPYGVFPITHVWTPSGWKEGYDGSGSVSDEVYGVDYGAAVVGTNGAGQTLDEAIGAPAQMGFNPPLTELTSGVTVIGYPGDAPYDGTTEYECTQSPQVLPIPGRGKEFRIGCTMTAGSSGGPWVATVGGAQEVVGNTSFTNGDAVQGSRWLTSTMLTKGAQQLYQSASNYRGQ